MELFKVKSKSLTSERAKDTIRTIALTLAKHFELDVVEDVLKSMIVGLDGGQERWATTMSETLLYIHNNIHNIKEVVNKNLLNSGIENYIKESHGWLSYQELDRELNILSPADKAYRRKIILRLAEKGTIEKHKTKGGLFQKIEKELEEIPWATADVKGFLDLAWPLELEKYVSIYPKSLVVIAGTKDSGKSAYLLNFIEMNMDRFPIIYYSSEMGPQILHNRLSLFDGVPEEAWKKVKWYPRTKDFAQIISPDAINIIDFYEITDNFFSVGNEFIEIFEKLDKGIAVIALQKDYGRKLGRGATFSMEKAAMYLSLEGDNLEIVSGKTWTNPVMNPVGIKIGFKLVQGHKFITKYVDTTPKEKIDDTIPF